jgi:hypothetical protein
LIIWAKALIREGKLKPGLELFVFTNNLVAERTYYKGSLSSPKLHQMILELRKMEMLGQSIIHFIWISGKRMITQGSDGLSRGDFSSGVMSGQHFLKHLPLDEGAFDRQTDLKSKLKACLPASDWKFASTEDWFTKFSRNQTEVGSGSLLPRWQGWRWNRCVRPNTSFQTASMCSYALHYGPECGERLWEKLLTPCSQCLRGRICGQLACLNH